MKKNKVELIILLFIGLVILIMGNQSYAAEETLKNATRIYYSAEVTRSYGNGDCILLENFDGNGNKIYGLVDTGRKISKNDSNNQQSTVVKEFLKEHGVDKLEFLLITHSHGDHNGDALTVIDNYEIKTIYMKEYDDAWSMGSGTQGRYEDIIERAVQKNIKVVGVSYISLTSNEVSPSRSQEFITNTSGAKENLFEAFNKNNTIFNFGSSKVKIFNWELFDENGEQYISGVTTDKKRETVSNENNNSLGLLLTQGSKKAFLAGDMDNLDENDAKGRIGDEDRIKDDIGKVDLLKLGHHGYVGSNTENYINVLNPQNVIITNDQGGMNKDIADWINANNVNYLYTTSDKYGISSTITNDSVYMGFETTGTCVKIRDKFYYIPDGEEYKNADYSKIAYNPKYQDKEVEVNSWENLKEVIEQNKNESINVDTSKKECSINKLIVNLKNSDSWNAKETIQIDSKQQVVLKTTDNITILRNEELKGSPLFLVKGSLGIGSKNMAGTISLDGNKNNVKSKTALVIIEGGTINLEKNVALCNNINQTEEKTKTATTIEYTSFGSAVYCKNGIININGADIVNNEQDVILTNTLPKEINNNFKYSSSGAGIYMTNNSQLNMNSGKINNNEARNNSVVTTDNDYTRAPRRGIIQQLCEGTGIYAAGNSTVNLLGGEISSNKSYNSSKTIIKKASNENIKTEVASINDSIYGTGIVIKSGRLKIGNGFVVSNNKAEVNTQIKLENDTSINSAVSAVFGTQIYINTVDTQIDGISVLNGEFSNNVNVDNNGKIGSTDNGDVTTSSRGGGICIYNSDNYTINNATIKKCNSGYGAGIYVNNSNGTISNSSIEENKATDNGGGIYATTKNTDLKLQDTRILNNTAESFGGGAMIVNNTSITGGEISGNTANKNAGGGIRVNGKLIMNNSTAKNNKAKTTGGGIDFTNGKFYLISGTIENNTAEQEGNEIYPEGDVSKDTIVPSLEIEPISNNWTNKNIQLKIKAKDEETGIKQVKIGNNVISENNGIYTYEIEENGIYKIVALDNSGNKVEKEIKISNIDKDGAKIAGVTNNQTYNSEIVISVTDLISGIKNVTLKKDGKEIEYKLGDKISESGAYEIIVEDNALNIESLNFKIDKSLNDDDIKIEGVSTAWSNQAQNIIININKQVKNVKINNSEIKVADGKYKFTANNNGIYKIEIEDLDGKKISKTVEVINIDKNKPQILGISDNNSYKDEVTLKIQDNESGISSITISKDGKSKVYNNNVIKLTESGIYEIKVTDNAGNITTNKFKIETEEKNKYEGVNDYDDNYEDKYDSGYVEDNGYIDDNIYEDDYYEEDQYEDYQFDEDYYLFDENEGFEYYNDETQEFESYEPQERPKANTYNLELPHAGKRYLKIGMAVFAIFSVICYIKYKKMNKYKI